VCFRPNFTLPSLPEKPGTNAPSELGLYSTPWKCIECGSSRRLSMFLKWIRKRSPTRARMSGPGISIPSLLARGEFGSGLRQRRLKRL
jgi:hypothetical protein